MSKPSWVTLSQNTGSSGTTIVTVTASTNEELVQRTGSLFIKTVSPPYIGRSVNLVQSAATINYSTMPLTVEITSAGQLSFILKSGVTESFILNDGEKETYTGQGRVNFTGLTAGDKIKIVGTNPYTADLSSFITGYESSAYYKVYGNINSLYNETGFTTDTGCGKFSYFCDGHVVDASNLILPATSLTENCYSFMFDNCTNLTVAPNLPATTLASYCYKQMFSRCTSLTDASNIILPATTLANYCYSGMFYGCTSLTTAPSLPATTLAQGCYSSMFEECTNLTVAPNLPVTTLAESCYNSMFLGCTGLTTAPSLPATTLANGCYQQMFSGCTNLNYVKSLATNISAGSSLYYWVSGVASTGTFVKKAGVTWPSGVSGIPSGWTVEEEP